MPYTDSPELFILANLTFLQLPYLQAKGREYTPRPLTCLNKDVSRAKEKGARFNSPN